jgi:6-pyruvoyltetrahydropterin/6-carboxytetrahydropterin synthase
LGATIHRVKLVESPNNSCEIDCSLLDNEIKPVVQAEPALVR